MLYRYISLFLILLSTSVFTQNKCDIYSWDKKINAYVLDAQHKNYKSYLDSLNVAGFYALEVDSIQYQVAHCNLYINKGNQYIDYLIKDKDFNSLEKIKDSLIQEGRVFSKITLSPAGFQENKPVYDISIEEKQSRLIDDIVFVGYSKIPKGYKNTLLETGKKANPSHIKEIEEKLENNKAIAINQPSKISYTKDSTILYVYTKKQKQNYFDGIIGFGTDANNKIKLNGNVQLSLVNALNKLEEINLQWMGSENKSQNLDLVMRYPYILFNKIGLHTDLHIRKQDSTYLQLRWNNGLTYQINAASYIMGNYSYETSNYINNDNNATSKGDYTKNGFGVGYFYKNDNTLLLNKNKLGLKVQTNLLNKKFKENKTTQSEIAYTLYRQQKIWKDHYLYAKLQGENLIQKEPNFLLNELYQLGGMNDLRGFNQHSIFTPSYNMATLAYRYIPNNAFLIELFSDFAIKEDSETQDLDYLFGFGTGLQFRVKFGVFKLMYAIGKEENQAIDFSNGKVHFGIKSIF